MDAEENIDDDTDSPEMKMIASMNHNININPLLENKGNPTNGKSFTVENISQGGEFKYQLLHEPSVNSAQIIGTYKKLSKD